MRLGKPVIRQIFRFKAAEIPDPPLFYMIIFMKFNGDSFKNIIFARLLNKL